MEHTAIPGYDSFFSPVIVALRSLGGSGSIQEIDEKVVEQEQFSDDVLSVIHEPGKSTQTEVSYRLAWARTYLKKYGLLENSSRGIWALTPKANEVDSIDPREIVRSVRSQAKIEGTKAEPEKTIAAEITAEDEWKQKLYQVLTQKLQPAVSSG